MLKRVKCGCWCGWISAFYPHTRIDRSTNFTEIAGGC